MCGEWRHLLYTHTHILIALKEFFIPSAKEILFLFVWLCVCEWAEYLKSWQQIAVNWLKVRTCYKKQVLSFWYKIQRFLNFFLMKQTHVTQYCHCLLKTTFLQDVWSLFLAMLDVSCSLGWSTTSVLMDWYEIYADIHNLQRMDQICVILWLFC